LLHSRIIGTKGFEASGSKQLRSMPQTMTLASGIHPGVLLALLCLGACDDRHWSAGYSSSNQPNSASGLIQQPTSINLYPSQDSNRLYVMVTAVGSQSVSMPLAFDTGSAGITLYAPAMSFPSGMLNANGFIFPKGQNTIVYNGITVTNLAATRLYGGATSGTTENGNIGFAQVTFGDAAGQLTTDVMTVFLYYSITQTGHPGLPAAVTHKQGWFGVNTEANLIHVTVPTTGAPANLPCSVDTGADCYVVGILKHLHYAPWIHPGFSLSPSPLQDCNITQAGKCTPVPMLRVGLTGEIESGFSQVTLTCPQPNYQGPDTIDGYLVCEDQVPFTTIQVTAPTKPTVTLSENVLFDSGNQAVNIVQSSGTLPATLLPDTTVSVVTPSGFTFTYTAENVGDSETSVATNGSAGIGINFFTVHRFFIDFATNTEGWM
jgi:hypothetical protein